MRPKVLSLFKINWIGHIDERYDEKQGAVLEVAYAAPALEPISMGQK